MNGIGSDDTNYCRLTSQQKTIL